MSLASQFHKMMTFFWTDQRNWSAEYTDAIIQAERQNVFLSQPRVSHPVALGLGNVYVFTDFSGIWINLDGTTCQIVKNTL